MGVALQAPQGADASGAIVILSRTKHTFKAPCLKSSLLALFF